ncbi:ABC-type transport auxiliary lipoprotein family protein [Massilia horti]|uniref:ABC-type transport auxiliary lipoprotein family protein n=1 Tax=Massilia horti TaxID=2562153 RepID=UPI0027D98862|nr:ABC-type transport auxiliary lipoprotein family protein [Massilia horti]
MNRRLSSILLACLLLAGCAGGKSSQSTTLFDFGSAAPAAAMADPPQAPLPALVVTDATGSAALDSERMFYRLNYADALQARSYANSRWSTSPLQMVTQRLKSRLAQAGVKVLSPSDAPVGVPILRVEVDDFIHAFASPAQSEGQLVLRASLFYGHALLDQRTFSHVTAAPTLDAAGGARALAASTDAAASGIVAWLGGLNLNTR